MSPSYTQKSDLFLENLIKMVQNMGMKEKSETKENRNPTIERPFRPV